MIRREKITLLEPNLNLVNSTRRGSTRPILHPLKRKKILTMDSRRSSTGQKNKKIRTSRSRSSTPEPQILKKTNTKTSQHTRNWKTCDNQCTNPRYQQYGQCYLQRLSRSVERRDKAVSFGRVKEQGFSPSAALHSILFDSLHRISTTNISYNTQGCRDCSNTIIQARELLDEIKSLRYAFQNIQTCPQCCYLYEICKCCNKCTAIIKDYLSANISDYYTYKQVRYKQWVREVESLLKFFISAERLHPTYDKPAYADEVEKLISELRRPLRFPQSSMEITSFPPLVNENDSVSDIASLKEKKIRQDFESDVLKKIQDEVKKLRQGSDIQDLMESQRAKIQRGVSRELPSEFKIEIKAQKEKIIRESIPKYGRSQESGAKVTGFKRAEARDTIEDTKKDGHERDKIKGEDDGRGAEARGKIKKKKDERVTEVLTRPIYSRETGIKDKSAEKRGKSIKSTDKETEKNADAKEEDELTVSGMMKEQIPSIKREKIEAPMLQLHVPRKKVKKRGQSSKSSEPEDEDKKSEKEKQKRPKKRRSKTGKKGEGDGKDADLDEPEENAPPTGKGKAQKKKNIKPPKLVASQSTRLIMDYLNQLNKREILKKEKSMSIQAVQESMRESLMTEPEVDVQRTQSDISTDSGKVRRHSKVQGRWMIKGNKIVKIERPKPEKKDDENNFKPNKGRPKSLISTSRPTYYQKKKILTTPESQTDTSSRRAYGFFTYQLSNPKFISNGYTKLPSIHIMRLIKIFKATPTYLGRNWFDRHKGLGVMFYDTGEKLAEIDDDGVGRWYYRNGVMALNCYKAEGHDPNNNQINTQSWKPLDADDIRLSTLKSHSKDLLQTDPIVENRFVVYSSGEKDKYGRKTFNTVLASFDSLGNGIVYDHSGNPRLKYNQTDGIILDEKIGAPGCWKWHTLNDPPVTDSVFVEKRCYLPRVLSEDQLSKSSQVFHKTKRCSYNIDADPTPYKPIPIRFKIFKLNKQFALHIQDQENIYLKFRDGLVSMKLELGVRLHDNCILDKAVTEMHNVTTPYDMEFINTSDSVAHIKTIVADTKDQIKHLRKNLRPSESCMV